MDWIGQSHCPPPLRRTAQNFALLFPSPATISFFFSLSLSLSLSGAWFVGGVWKRRGPKLCTFRLLGCCVKPLFFFCDGKTENDSAEQATSINVSTRQPTNQTCTFVGPSKQPQRERRKKKMVVGKKKTRNFGPHPSGPHPLGNPPSSQNCNHNLP